MGKNPKFRVVVSGTGTLSPFGEGSDQLLRAALAETTAVRDGLGRIPEEVLARHHNSKNEGMELALCRPALEEALRDASWGSLGPRDGFILATTVGQPSLWQRQLMDCLKKGEAVKADELAAVLRKQPLGTLLEDLCEIMDFQGPRLLVTSACAAGTQALALAALWIEEGRVDRCLVGGIEFLCDLTVEGFRSLQLLSPEACRPFDLNRSGINLSETASFICLESAKNVPQSRHQAYVLGCGFSTDAYHSASPEPSGSGIERSMRMAMEMADLSPLDIDWIHAHGTASIANDLSEGNAVSRIFSADPEHSPISSTKWLHGHALGASGVLESILCVHALREGWRLRSFGLSEKDPAISYPILRKNERTRPRFLLKNTLGFGGNNASLVLGAP